MVRRWLMWHVTDTQCGKCEAMTRATEDTVTEQENGTLLVIGTTPGTQPPRPAPGTPPVEPPDPNASRLFTVNLYHRTIGAEPYMTGINLSWIQLMRFIRVIDFDLCYNFEVFQQMRGPITPEAARKTTPAATSMADWLKL